MPIDAGRFDPTPANFYHKVTAYTNREPVQTEELFYTTWIRFPYMARTGNELPVTRQMLPAGQILIRVRRDPTSAQIDPSMTMVHNDQRYGIICINPIPSNERDEIELLVQFQLQSTVHT